MTIETIFFDRDGIINDVVIRADKISSPRTLSEFQIRADFRTFYKQLPKELNLFVVSNQPDVARQLLLPAALKEMNQELQSVFSFSEIVYCPHDEKDNCQCRKPKPGMLNNLIARYNIDKDKAIILGDSEKDILAGQAAGIKTVYFKDSHNQMPSCHPDFIIAKLNDMLGILKTYRGLKI